MEECLVPTHRNQHFQWLGATTEMPKMRKVELRRDRTHGRGVLVADPVIELARDFLFQNSSTSEASSPLKLVG